MSNKYDIVFLELADSLSKLSYANRKKVGALIVKDNSIIADGYNGTPAGYCNDCEDENGNTHWYVLHAEANAITKLAKCGASSTGATLYITMSPCKECTKLIIQSGIKRVVYSSKYKDNSGINFLGNFNVKCEYIHINGSC
jgi:dCMP deaminase